MATSPSTTPAEQRKLLVIGSSVAEGYNADANFGWTAMLAKALTSHGVQTNNRAVAGTNTEFWQEHLHDVLPNEELACIDIVVLSLSMANEGLPGLHSDEDMDALTDKYLKGYHAIVQALRQHLVKPGARIIVGCPYPNDDYKPCHLARLERVRDEINSWAEVDHAVDFLTPLVHAGAGRWCEGLASDAGHPNSEGHAQMFACVDLGKVLGQ